FSSSDRLGNVLQKAFELLMNMAKNGVDAQSLKFAIKSLDVERKHIMEFDDQREDALRDFVYGLFACLGDATEALLEFEETKGQIVISQQEPVLVHVQANHADAANIDLFQPI
ncbi:hypothetical protein PFISCL1PPCAC_22544, partial [Pristionchus fissidentatus]